MIRAVWIAAVGLALLGVAAGVLRMVYPEDLAHRMDPVRQTILDRFGITDPGAAERPAELRRFDGSFASHPWITRMHIVPGGIFLALAPFQFSRRLRTRHPRVHRWNGRTLVVMALLSGVAGLFFGLAIPFAGPAESLVIGLVGGLLLLSVAKGFAAIRRGEVTTHRRWMIRAFAAAVAISTVRLVAIPLDLLLTPAGVSPAMIFLISISGGWLLTLLAAEGWIRRRTTI